MLGMTSVAWGRYQQLYMSTLGFKPTYIGLLTALGLFVKVVGYSIWAFVMDLRAGSTYVLAATVVISAVSLEGFRVGELGMHTALFTTPAHQPTNLPTHQPLQPTNPPTHHPVNTSASSVYGSTFLIVLTKSLRSLANSQYTLLDSVTMRTVGGGSKVKSASDMDEGASDKLMGLEEQRASGGGGGGGEGTDDAGSGVGEVGTATALNHGDGVSATATAAGAPPQPTKASYGSARVWGSIGWAAASPVVGQLIDRFGVSVIFTYT